MTDHRQDQHHQAGGLTAMPGSRSAEGSPAAGTPSGHGRVARAHGLGLRLGELLSLERAAHRSLLALVLVILTLTSPFLALPGGLPAIRLEQVVLLLVSIPLLRYIARHPEHRRVRAVDIAFAALLISTAVTVAAAPLLVEGASRSYRDVFELVRVVEYWLVFRIGASLEPPRLASMRLARWIAVAAVLLGVLAVIQYLNPPPFNDTVTAIWTAAHNLLGVLREGRAVGTAGNANQFAILLVVALFIAMAGRIGLDRGPKRWLWIAAIISAAVGLALAQSRGAILGAGLGIVTASVILAARGSLRSALVRTVPAGGIAVAIVLGLATVAPPASGGILHRFDLSAIGADPSVAVRVGRVEGLFGQEYTTPTPGADRDACVASLTPAPTPAPGHEPGEAPPEPAPTRAAARVATAVARYYCSEGTWPAGLEDLVPTYLPVLPATAAGEPFGLYSSDRGYSVGTASSIDSTAEQEGAGSLPNLLENPSFESGGDPPTSWRVAGGAVARTDPASAGFSAAGARAELSAGGALYQLVAAELPAETQYTFGAWVRSFAAHRAGLQLYVVAVTTKGETIDPVATSTSGVSGSDGWQHLALTFKTPAVRLATLRFMIRAPEVPVRIDVDGVSLVEGPFALPFASLVDRSAAGLRYRVGPSLWDSPLVGVGPLKTDTTTVYDNEFVSVLVHYGVLGLVAFVILFLAAFALGVRAARRLPGWGGLLGVALAATTVALGGFAVSAGAYRQLQVMVVYWLIVGAVAAVVAHPRRTSSLPADGAS